MERYLGLVVDVKRSDFKHAEYVEIVVEACRSGWIFQATPQFGKIHNKMQKIQVCPSFPSFLQFFHPLSVFSIVCPMSVVRSCFPIQHDNITAPTRLWFYLIFIQYVVLEPVFIYQYQQQVRTTVYQSCCLIETYLPTRFKLSSI